MSQNKPSFLERHRARRELPELTRQIADLLSVGERMDEALDTVAELTASDWLRHVTLQLRKAVQDGTRFSDALRDHPAVFSEYYVAMAAVGEVRGDVSGALTRIAEQLLRQQRFSDAVKTALSYPLLVLFVTGVSMILLLVYVLPEFNRLFEDSGIELPWFAGSVLGAGGYVRSYGLIILLFGMAAVVLWRARLRQPEALYRWHRFQLWLPFVSDLVRRIDVVRFSDSLAAALAGGTTLLEGLRLSQASVANRCLRRSLNGVIENVKEGGRLGQKLHETCGFPLLASRMIQVGEESGELEQSLRRVADVYDREFDILLKRILNILEPVLIIGIGAVVAVIVLAMVSAIQQLNSAPF